MTWPPPAALANTNRGHKPYHGGTKPPPIPPSFTALPPPEPQPNYSITDLFDLATWAAVVIPYLAAIAESVATTVDKHVRAAIDAVQLDKLFVAEEEFGLALQSLHSAKATLALSRAAVPIRVSAEEAGRPTSSPSSPSPRFASSLALDMAESFIVESKACHITRVKCNDARAIMHESAPSNSTWRPVSVDKATGYGTYYRGEPGLATQSFKVVGLVHAEVVALACVLLELDLYKEWFPFCYISDICAEDGRFHKSSRFAIRLPFPLANREVAITGFGLDDLDRLRVCVKACSMANEQPTKGNVLAELKLGGFFIEPVGKMDTRITFFMNIDPHIPHLPMWLLNWISGNLMWVVLRQISKAAEKAMDPKSVYAKRRASRPDVYTYFTQRAKEIVAGLPDHGT